MMKKLKNHLEDASHSVSGISRVCALILLFGASLIGLVSLLPTGDTAEPTGEDLISRLMIRYIMQDLPPDIFQDSSNPLPTSIDWIFVGPDPPEGLLFAYGFWQWQEGDPSEAVATFLQEDQAYPNPLVKQMALDAALSSGDRALLERLTNDPDFQPEVSAGFELSRGIQEENWSRILRSFIPAQFELLEPIPIVLTLFSGTIWSIILFSFYPSTPPKALLGLGLLGLILGAISTWPTVISALWMELELGITEGTEFFSTLFFMLVSVGLREEVCKVLLFAPLLVYTVKPGRDLEALLLGGFVGLGFAIEENISYLSGFSGGVAISRFVSANMLHFFLTGVTALALTRAVRNPEKWLVDSLQLLVFAIGLHGIYNTLLSHPVPGLGDVSTFAWAALTGCAALFFRELETLAPPRGRKMTRTGVLCWGFCGLVCLELAWATAHLSFNDALNQVGQAALAGVFTIYIFVHYMREAIR